MVERKDFLNEVYGYEEIKDELYQVLGWYKNNDLDIKKKEYLPHGILFYGDPGYGKTLLVREFAKSFDYKIYVLEGDSENLDEELVSTYNKAKEEKDGAIVIIDEIDRLIDKDSRLERVLQTQLDGFNKNVNVLTLATANNFYNLPKSLIREGRFDRKFEIEIRDEDDLKIIVEKLLETHNFDLKNNKEGVEELILHLKDHSVSKIKALFNSVYLRYGKDASLDDFLNENYFFDNGVVNKKEKYDIPKFIAIHEAGHALYIYKFSKTQKLLRVCCSNGGGKTYSTSNKMYISRDSEIESIQIALSGLIAEEIFFKKHDIGCKRDLRAAYKIAFSLMNEANIEGIDNNCPEDFDFEPSYVSEFEKTSYIKKTNKLIKKNYRIVKKKLKKCKKELLLIAEKLVKQQTLTRGEITKIIKTKSQNIVFKK